MRTYQFDKKGSEIQELLDQIKNKTIYGNATTETAGLMSAEDKETLDTLVDNVGENIQQLSSLNQAVSENTTAIETNTDNIATNTNSITALNATTGNLGTRLDAAEETLDNIFQLDANNFMGIYDAAANLPAMTGAGWALVGADLTALNAYVYNIPQAQWQQYGNTTYDYSDYSGLVTQMATIGFNLDELNLKVDGLEINLLKTTTIVTGERIANAGYIMSDASFWRTETIPIAPETELTSVGENIGIDFHFCFYNAVTISQANFVSKTSGRKATVPDNASYVVITSMIAKNPASTSIVCRSSDITTEYPTLGMDTIIGGVYDKDEIDTRIGDLANLQTTDKSSAVNAINEIDSKITPSISSTEIAIDIDGTKAASIEHFDSSLFDNVPTYDEVHDIVEEAVVDSLDSDATNKPLSASKGKELNGRITPEIGHVGGISTDIDGTKSVSPEYFDSSLIENVPTYDELVDIDTNIYLYPRTIHIPQWPNIFYTYHPLYEEVTLTSNNKLINII